jgi:hypothetical protein
VIGQTGFTTSTRGTTSTTLYYPAAVAFDVRGDLWVADEANNRVLMYRP